MRAAPDRWPEFYGFAVWGRGPTYVVLVEKGSIADEAGLTPGDHVLEVDGSDVSLLNAEEVKVIARRSAVKPPTLGVVSRIQMLEIPFDHNIGGYGFALKSARPIVVDSVNPYGPAFKTGLRKGDAVLQVNGYHVSTAEVVNMLLVSESKITLGILTTSAKDGSIVSGSALNGRKSKNNKAKELYSKMNHLLGPDYEKKMTVIGLMKQYAEDRDVANFVKNLLENLMYPDEQHLLSEIRNLIPPRHLATFDRLIETRESESSLASTVTTKGRRVVTIDRTDDGSFGFVLRGHNPVVVESVEPGGSAARVGLRPGDCFLKLNGLDVSRCTHAHLVQLLQGSGSTPSIEVLHKPEIVNDFGTRRSGPHGPSTRSSSLWESSLCRSTSPPLTVTSQRTLSSHRFKDLADGLLSYEARRQLKHTLEYYKSTADVEYFAIQVAALFDSPEKQVLWSHLLPKLPVEHRRYCMRRVPAAGEVMSSHTEQQNQHDALARAHSAPMLHEFRNHESATLPRASRSTGTVQLDHLGSFKQQLEYLLTSRERSHLKRALQSYATKRDINALLDEMLSVLDTPSKRTLWLYIIPLLSMHHQDYCRDKLKIPHSVGTSASRTMKNRSAISGADLEEDSFRMIGEAASLLRQRAQRVTGVPISSSSDDDYRQTSSMTLPDSDSSVPEGPHDGTLTLRKHVQTPAVTRSNFQTVQGPSDLSSSSSTLPPGSLIAHQGNDSGLYQGQNAMVGSENALNWLSSYDNELIHHEEENPYEPFEHDGSRGAAAASRQNSRRCVHDGNVYRVNGDKVDVQNIPHDASFLLVESEESTSWRREDSFDARAFRALKALDEAVDGVDEDGRGSSGRKSPESTETSVIPEAPPIIHHVPIPPAPPNPAMMVKSDGPVMNVKRLNWDKLEVNDLQGTVWGQISSDKALEEVVNFLELEEQFAMTRPKPKPVIEGVKQIKKICIMNQKKAYNISILLAHLKLPVSKLRDALYEMNDSIYTPELLTQLLQYAPNLEETEKYDSYSGPLEALSVADQLGCLMTRVAGYEQRLRAMLFKANFAEKANELRTCLAAVGTASRELVDSRRLARVFELILAMGNFLNRGNRRIGDAEAFRISSLEKLESTKTSDGKSSLLHVLVETVQKRYPDCVDLRQELPTVPKAARVEQFGSNAVLSEELKELKSMIQDTAEITFELMSLCYPKKFEDVDVSNIEAILDKLKKMDDSNLPASDKFGSSMNQFLQSATDEIQELFSLQADSSNDLERMLKYFGEDPKTTSVDDIFATFSRFLIAYERAHHQNISSKRH